MRKFQLISAITILFMTSLASAGDNGGGNISCVSASGKTKVAGAAGAEYNGAGPAALTYSIETGSLDFTTSNIIEPATVLVDFVSYKHGVSYEVTIKRATVNTAEGYASNREVFHLKSVAGSFTKTRKADVFRFVGVIPAYSSLDPRKAADLLSNDYFDKDITVNCELDVSL